MVDRDGKNNYPRDEVWLTDGYGDYVRHYLNAMAALPTLAPSDQNHILQSTSIIQQVDYAPNFTKKLNSDVKKEDMSQTFLYYRTFDKKSTELIKLTQKPAQVKVNKAVINEVKNVNEEGWQWQPLALGGVLHITHINGNTVTVYKQ
jgi:hypothetical protein